MARHLQLSGVHLNRIQHPSFILLSPGNPNHILAYFRVIFISVFSALILGIYNVFPLHIYHFVKLHKILCLPVKRLVIIACHDKQDLCVYKGLYRQRISGILNIPDFCSVASPVQFIFNQAQIFQFPDLMLI